MDGLRELCARLGALSRCRLMSADRSEALQTQAAGLGLSVLIKPIAPARLAEIVAAAQDRAV